MSKLKMPKNPHTGLKIFCSTCKKDNPNCNHYDMQQYRVRIHIPNTKNKVKVKIFETREYDEAVKQSIDFKRELIGSGYELVKPTEEGNDYSLAHAIVKYNQYLGGNHPLEQKKKFVTKEHQSECIRFCLFFADVVKNRADVTRLRVVEINKYDASDYCKWAKTHYGSKAYNKSLQSLKAFFTYLIKDEDVVMKNPFESFVRMKSEPNENLTITKSEFELILNTVDTADPLKKLGGRGEVKNMYRPYLKDGFQLLLLTGLRREEAVALRWSNLFTNIQNSKCLRVPNLKVERAKKEGAYLKTVVVTPQLLDFLNGLGYAEKANSNEYIIFPERKVSKKTIMNDLSKAFTHYLKASNIERDLSLKSLRKTYISWTKIVMGEETGIYTGHAEDGTIVTHYFDPTMVVGNEKAQKVKIFG